MEELEPSQDHISKSKVPLANTFPLGPASLGLCLVAGLAVAAYYVWSMNTFRPSVWRDVSSVFVVPGVVAGFFCSDRQSIRRIGRHGAYLAGFATGLGVSTRVFRIPSMSILEMELLGWVFAAAVALTVGCRVIDHRRTAQGH